MSICLSLTMKMRLLWELFVVFVLSRAWLFFSMSSLLLLTRFYVRAFSSEKNSGRGEMLMMLSNFLQ